MKSRALLCKSLPSLCIIVSLLAPLKVTAQSNTQRMDAVFDVLIQRCPGSEQAILAAASEMLRNSDGSDANGTIQAAQAVVRTADICLEKLQPGSGPTFYIEGYKLMAQHAIAQNLETTDSRKSSATMIAYATALDLCTNPRVGDDIFPYRNSRSVILTTIAATQLLYDGLREELPEIELAQRCAAELTGQPGP